MTGDWAPIENFLYLYFYGLLVAYLNFRNDLSYDPEDGVWSGTSKDIPGLFLEADSFTEFLSEAKDIAPYLISRNLNIAEGEIKICIITDNIASLRKERGSSPRTTYALQNK